MAKIYPSNYDLNIIKNHSYAEYKIIKAIENMDSNKTKDWIIYYSYCFKRRENSKSLENKNIKSFNEIDFLILAPNLGIFVFEIKGGKIIKENGSLYSVDRDNVPHLINPYEQAKENYYGLKDVLGSFFDEEVKDLMRFDSYVGGTMIGFPDIDAKGFNAFYSDGKDTFIDGMDLYNFICGYSKYINKGDKVLPTNKVINILVNKLNGPDFQYKKDKKHYIDSVNLSISDLTYDQETVFRGLLSNKRCLIKGGAGTGKTVLCEFLYKHLVLEKKYSVIYFTYNKLIAQRLNSDLKLNDTSNCYPIYEYLENEYIKFSNSDIPEDINNDFSLKKQFLLENVSKILENNFQSKKYDCLIIDEAQDIDLDENIIYFFDNLLNGGLKNGLCYIFYDSNQNIFDVRNEKIYESEYFSDTYGYRYAQFELLRNCRNSKGIVNSTYNLLKGNKKSNDLKNNSKLIVNEDVKYFSITENVEGALKIKKIIDELLDEETGGVKKNQITLLFNLSKNNKKNIIYNELKKYYKIEDYDPNGNKGITYATVSGFKGLENDIIIYINDNEYSKVAVHYVAISRAKVLSYIFKVVE